MHALTLACLLVPLWPAEPSVSLDDLHRFAPDAAAWVTFSERLEQHVKTQQRVYPWRYDALEAIREEILACRRPWQLLAIAQAKDGCWDEGGWCWVSTEGAPRTAGRAAPAAGRRRLRAGRHALPGAAGPDAAHRPLTRTFLRRTL